MSWHSGVSFDPPSSLAQHSPPSAGTSPSSGRKRKRSSTVGGGVAVGGEENGGGGERAGSMSGSLGDASPVTAAGGKVKHQPGVKRACNDCRQQKLRCNVQAGPGDYYKACDRCIKHKLHCSIDNDFKRLGKRAQHEEMVKELDQCKARLAQFEALGMRLPGDENPTAAGYTGMASQQPFLGPNEAAASRSLLDLSQGYRELPPVSYPSITPGTSPTTLRHVTLTDDQLTELYQIYFASYHPFLPLLNPEFTYHQYYNLHPLLHWTIISVAARHYVPKPSLLVELQNPLEEMVWTTLSQVPQVYHVCKALALLCSWPLPNSSTSQEPTMMLTGVMFQLAMQYGLHRPSHAQDFSRFRVDLREEDIADRLNTWATVNIVAQSVSTGQGQPPLSRWAWYTYGIHLDRMKVELHSRCQIEKFVDTVTRTLFTMQRDHVVEVDQAQRGLQIDMYARELNEMETTLLSTRSSPVDRLYLKAAALHLRLTAFFDKPTSPNYLNSLKHVFIAASSLLEVVLDLPSDIFQHVPRYIEQIILAASVTLLKLLHSFYASRVDQPRGRTLFSRSVAGLRRLSVRSNDLPQRLAEVMAQLWVKSAGDFPEGTSGDLAKVGLAAEQGGDGDGLQLHVRCRGSLSVFFDAIWRWRHQVGQDGRAALERAVEHPTNVNSSDRNTPVPTGGAGGGLLVDDGLGVGTGLPEFLDPAFGGNAVFDTLGWALDQNLPFSAAAGGLLGGTGLFGAEAGAGLGGF